MLDRLTRLFPFSLTQPSAIARPEPLCLCMCIPQAFPVLARILNETNMLRTTVGNTAMGAAALDDVTAWYGNRPPTTATQTHIHPQALTPNPCSTRNYISLFHTPLYQDDRSPPQSPLPPFNHPTPLLSPPSPAPLLAGPCWPCRSP